MADTSRSSSTLLTTLFPDTQTLYPQKISPLSPIEPTNLVSLQDLRDLIVSLTPPFMGVYVSSSSETTINTQSVFEKIAGTTSVTHQSADFDDASSTNNRMRFIGVEPRHMHIVAQASITLTTGTNQRIGVKIWHYDDSAASGSYLDHSHAQTTIASTDIEQITTHGDVLMDTNDYLEMHVANHTNTNNVTAETLYMFAMGKIV